MIKLVDIVKTTPGLEYHLKHKLRLMNDAIDAAFRDGARNGFRR
jgi:hypothetical protein